MAFNLALAYAVEDVQRISPMDEKICALVGTLPDESGCGFGMRDMQWYDLPTVPPLENLGQITLLPNIDFVTVTEAEKATEIFHWDADTKS